ncbi:MAG: dienelactone hydrolase family protein [Pseudomonadota bacterium]
MAIQTQELAYTAGDSTMKSYLAYDDAVSGPRPGVMVIHEWWGLDDYICRRTRQLAELGYVALGVDMYGDGKTAATPDEAGALMNGVLEDMESGTARIQAAAAALGGQSQTDASKMASMGYCFGGAMSLHAARIGMDLRGVVSFHGALGSFHAPAEGSVKAQILVLHGGGDVLVPDEQIDAFHQEMDAARAQYEFITYDGAMHGYTNPEATGRGEKYGLPLAYDEQTDQRSWQDMQDFFNKIFA